MSYIFADRDAEELHRLRLVEQAFDATTIRLLESAAIREGGSCLEVGAGAGSILRWLGERVGPEGLAVGVDRSTDFLGEFNRRPYRIEQVDVLNFETNERFDLIHVRYVLIHNKNPASLLARLKTLLAPGGCIVAEEPDFEASVWHDDTYAEPCNRVNEAIHALFADGGMDPGYGRRLPAQLSDIGMSLDHVETNAHTIPGKSPVAESMAVSTIALMQKYLNTGKASRHDLDLYVRGARDPGSLATYYATVSVVSGTTN